MNGTASTSISHILNQLGAQYAELIISLTAPADLHADISTLVIGCMPSLIR